MYQHSNYRVDIGFCRFCILKSNNGFCFSPSSKFAVCSGTCSPRFLRSTMYNIPCTGELLKQSHLPFVVTLVPFARLHPKEVVSCLLCEILFF